MFARSQTCSIIGLPARVARAFPGYLEEANRAGMTPKIRVRTSECSTMFLLLIVYKLGCLEDRDFDDRHPAQPSLCKKMAGNVIRSTEFLVPDDQRPRHRIVGA